MATGQEKMEGRSSNGITCRYLPCVSDKHQVVSQSEVSLHYHVTVNGKWENVPSTVDNKR